MGRKFNVEEIQIALKIVKLGKVTRLDDIYLGFSKIVALKTRWLTDFSDILCSGKLLIVFK